MLKDRLDLIIKELGLSGRQFEKECGLPPGSYSSISDGVGAKYPQISLDWIIMGDGDMFKKNESQIEKIDKNSERIDKLLDIVASQQKTIELLAQKGAAADVQGVAGKAVQG